MLQAAEADGELCTTCSTSDKLDLRVPDLRVPARQPALCGAHMPGAAGQASCPSWAAAKWQHTGEGCVTHLRLTRGELVLSSFWQRAKGSCCLARCRALSTSICRPSTLCSVAALAASSASSSSTRSPMAVRMPARVAGHGCSPAAGLDLVTLSPLLLDEGLDGACCVRWLGLWGSLEVLLSEPERLAGCCCCGGVLPFCCWPD